MVISTDANGKPTVVAGDGDGDLTYLVDLMYPVGSYFMTTHGATNPGKLLGGQWDIVAENVVMPLGSEAPVLTGETEHIWSYTPVLKFKGNYYGQSSTSRNLTAQGNSGAVLSGQSYGYGEGGAPLAPSNLYARLNQSSNAISGVDVYRRSL